MQGSQQIFKQEVITDKVGGSSAKPEVSKQSKEKRLKHKVSGYKSQSKRRSIAGCRLLLRTLVNVFCSQSPPCLSLYKRSSVFFELYKNGIISYCFSSGMRNTSLYHFITTQRKVWSPSQPFLGCHTTLPQKFFWGSVA